MNHFEFLRMIDGLKRPAVELIEKLRSMKPATFIEFPTEPVERMIADLPGSPGQAYMRERGFTDETLKHFDIGYSYKRDMVIVPMHDPTGMLVGFIGRSVEGKVFKNTNNLPKSKTAWNYHRAKRYGDTVIVNEASFDSMSIHQAGYPNVISLLGGTLSKNLIDQLNKTFSTIIIMTDFDKAGRKLGWDIANALPFKKIRWAVYDEYNVFPGGLKDANSCADQEIAQMLRSPITSLEYRSLDLDPSLVVH